jgi:hypothetical protein
MELEDLEETRATVGDIPADLPRSGYRLVTDTVDEMECWACFQPKRSRMEALPGSRAFPGTYVTDTGRVELRHKLV